MASTFNSLSPDSLGSSSSDPSSLSLDSSRPSYLTPDSWAPEPQHFKVAWICPLPIEMDAARAAFTEEYKYDSEKYKRDHGIDPSIDSNIYYFGRIDSYKVVLCQPCYECGGQHIAFEAWLCLTHSFDSIKYLFLVGIAGGIPQPDNNPDIRLGDVVIGLPSKPHPGVMQVDSGSQTGDGIPEPTASLKSSHRDLQHWARQVIRDHKSTESYRKDRFSKEAKRIRGKISKHAQLGSGLSWDCPGEDYDVCFEADHSCQSHAPRRRPEDWCPAKCGELPKVSHSDSRPEGTQIIHGGLICSINCVMKHAPYRDKLATTICKEQPRSKILCFEMEGRGIAEETECLQVRGICDYSDSHKTKRWQPYAAIQAVAVASLIVTSLSDSKNKDNPRMTSINPCYTRDQVKTQESASSASYSSFMTPSKELGLSTTGSKSSAQKRRNSSLQSSQARGRLIQKPKKLIKQETPLLGLEVLFIDMGTEIPNYYLLDKAAAIPTFDKDHHCEFKVHIRTPNDMETRTRIEEQKHGRFKASWAIESVSTPSIIKSKLLTFRIDHSGEIIQFWLPTDDIKYVKKEFDSVFEWSDCRSFIRKITQGRERPYPCYNAERPNLTLSIAFDNTKVANTFSELMLQVNLEDSGWQPCKDYVFEDISRRKLEVYLEKSLEESRVQPNQAIIVGRHNALASSFVKLYRIQEFLKLSATSYHGKISSFAMSNIQVLDFRANALFEETDGRHQMGPKNGRPSEQVWSTYEHRPVPFEIPKVEKPTIKLKPEHLARHLASIMSWSANEYMAYASIKFPGISLKKRVVLYCGIHKSHNSSTIHFFCYHSKDKKWFLLEVDCKKQPNLNLSKAHSIAAFIKKKSISTDKIRLDPFASVKEVNTSVTITLSGKEDHLAIKDIFKKNSANSFSESNVSSSPSQT